MKENKQTVVTESGTEVNTLPGKKKNAYFGLICFDVCFWFINLFCLEFIDLLPSDTGYGGLAIGIPLLLVDFLIMPFRGGISYVKYGNVLKTNLVFVVNWLIVTLVLLFAVSSYVSLCFSICVVSLCLSMFGSITVMLISKARKRFSKTNEKERVLDETSDNSLLSPLTAKPGELLEKQKEAKCETLEKIETACDSPQDHENPPSEK